MFFFIIFPQTTKSKANSVSPSYCREDAAEKAAQYVLVYLFHAA